MQRWVFQVKVISDGKYHTWFTGQIDLKDDSGRNRQRQLSSPASRETERKYNCYFSLFISRLWNAAQYESVSLVLRCITLICHFTIRDLPWARAKSTFAPQSTSMGFEWSRQRISSQILWLPLTTFFWTEALALSVIKYLIQRIYYFKMMAAKAREYFRSVS